MTIYAGLDISDKSTHICVIDSEGTIVWRGVCATDPEVLAFTQRKQARDVARVVLETGSLSAFLWIAYRRPLPAAARFRTGFADRRRRHGGRSWISIRQLSGAVNYIAAIQVRQTFGDMRARSNHSPATMCQSP